MAYTFFQSLSFRRAPNVNTPKLSSRKSAPHLSETKFEEKSPSTLQRKGFSFRKSSSMERALDEAYHSQAQDLLGSINQSCCVSCYSGYSKKGYAPHNPGKKNQDSLFMFEHAPTQSLIFCVLDGHGEFGDKVSQFFKNHLPNAISEHADFLTNPRNAISESIHNLELRLFREDVNCRFSGSTLTLCLVRGFQLIIANIGDSRITLGTRISSESIGLIGRAISIDHKPDLPEERERILKAGGRVFSIRYDDGIDGPPRVWLKHQDIPGLAMSRSLGDTVAHSVGVSSVPDFFELNINPQTDCCIIVASDGLWEFIDDQEAIDLVTKYSEPRGAVRALINLASDRWLRDEQVIDDTTVCVAYLNNWSGSDI